MSGADELDEAIALANGSAYGRSARGPVGRSGGDGRSAEGGPRRDSAGGGAETPRPRTGPRA